MGEQTDTDPVRRYVVSSLTPQGFVEEGTSYDYLIDHLYTAHEVVDETGVTVWQGDYASESFGEVNITTEVVTNNLRFPGQYADAESGLYYNWFRYYDSELGQFIQDDPIGVLGRSIDPQLNILQSNAFIKMPYLYEINHGYNYGDSNPIMLMDYNGLFFCGDHCGSGGSTKWIIDGPYTEACRRHDRCYAKCGMTKKQCDQIFADDGASLYSWALQNVFRDESTRAYNNAQRQSGCNYCIKPGTPRYPIVKNL